MKNEEKKRKVGRPVSIHKKVHFRKMVLPEHFDLLAVYLSALEKKVRTKNGLKQILKQSV